MDRMENARAVFFLEEDDDLSTRPLMLQRVLFCPILAWLRQQLRAEGIGRFFVWYPPESPWTEEFRACFEPEDDVTLSADREVLRTFLREEGLVTVFPDAEIPLRLEGRGYAYRAQASALIEGWLDSPNSSEVRGWEPYGNSTPILSLGDLQAQELAIRDMIVAKHMEKGVRFLDPSAVYLDPRVEIGAGTMILPGTILRGKTRIGRDCEIGPSAMIRDCTVGDRTEVNASQCNESSIGSDTHVGPFAYIRPNCTVGDHIKVGDFVELKNSSIGDGTKISHLTYVGDSDVGQRVNFGCGTITTNYDGFQKYRCQIGDGAFIGCNTNLVAPVRIGSGAYTAAGSTVTKDVPDDALHIARPEEIIKDGWAKRRRQAHGKE